MQYQFMSSRFIRHLMTGASALFLSAAAASSAGAQFLDEIIVTATKRSENVQNIPVSVATVSGEKLAIIASGGLDVRFLSARVPSLQIESSFGRTFPRFYIRGLGNTDFDLNSSQPVSLVYDDVILENPILKGFPVFDLERIEVLRGPQGTLFGRNTPAGIVKFDSAKPTEEFDAYGRINYGRFNAVNLEGAVGGSLIGDIVTTRLSFMYQRRDDWVDNLAPGFEQADALEGFNEFAGRMQFLFEPNEQFSALANVHGRYLRGTARVFRGNIATTDGDGPADDLTIFPDPLTMTGGTSFSFERDEVFNDSPNFQEVNEFGGVLNMSYDFGSVTLTSITGYENVEIFTRGDIDGGTGDFLEADFLQNVLGLPPAAMGPGFIPFRADTQDNIPGLDQWTEEIRLSSNEWGRFDWQLGFFYFHENVDIETFDFGDTAVQGLSDPVAVGLQNQKTNSWAIFASADYDVTDRLNVRGGVRYTDESKDFRADRPIDTRPGFLLFGGTFTPDPVSTDDEVITWDIAATFALNDDTNLYARIARGFRAPSIQGRIAFFQIDPITGNDPNDSISVGDTETILSYEGGIKATVFGGRGRVNFGGFYYNIKDQQLTAVGGGGNFNTLLNADETKGYGFELDMEFEPIDNLLITAGTSYNFTEIQDSDLTVAGCGSQQCTITDPFVTVADPSALPPVAGLPGVLSIVNIDGNRLPQSPRWIANWTVRYGIPFMGGELFAYTDWALRTRVNFFLYESVEFQDEFLIEGGLRVGYNWNEGQYEVAAFGRNITNDQSLTGGIDFNNQVGFINEPPIWGIEASFRL